MDRVLDHLAATEGVRSVAAAYPLPFGPVGRWPVIAEGAPSSGELAPTTGVLTVSPGYFATMGVRLRAGRTFQPTDDQASPPVVVISEVLARRLSPDGTVIGSRIRVRVPHLSSFDDHDERPWRTVVGVVTDTKKNFAAGAGPDVPDVYVPYAQNPRARQSIIVRTDRAEPTPRRSSHAHRDLARPGARGVRGVRRSGTSRYAHRPGARSAGVTAWWSTFNPRCTTTRPCSASATPRSICRASGRPR
jgi:hypothetical protein